MKKSVCVLSVLVALSACGSSWKFWEDSDEEKAQAAMSQRRAPTLNGPVGMPQAPAGFENPMLPPMMPTDPMAQGGMPQIPPPPIDNADSMPLPPTMPPAYSPNLPPPMPEPAPSVLPNGRRAPNYNAQALGIKDIPNSSAPAVVSARPLTPAPQINSAPLPSNMPSMVPPPPPPAFAPSNTAAVPPTMPPIPSIPPVPPSAPAVSQEVIQNNPMMADLKGGVDRTGPTFRVDSRASLRPKPTNVPLDSSGYPRLGSIPPTSQPPIPVSQDPRAQQLRQQMNNEVMMRPENIQPTQIVVGRNQSSPLNVPPSFSNLPKPGSAPMLAQPSMVPPPPAPQEMAMNNISPNMPPIMAQPSFQPAPRNTLIPKGPSIVVKSAGSGRVTSEIHERQLPQPEARPTPMQYSAPEPRFNSNYTAAPVAQSPTTNYLDLKPLKPLTRNGQANLAPIQPPVPVMSQPVKQQQVAMTQTPPRLKVPTLTATDAAPQYIPPPPPPSYLGAPAASQVPTTDVNQLQPLHGSYASDTNNAYAGRQLLPSSRYERMRTRARDAANY